MIEDRDRIRAKLRRARGLDDLPEAIRQQTDALYGLVYTVQELLSHIVNAEDADDDDEPGYLDLDG